MKDYLLELVAARTGYNAKLNIMREYLQAYILRIMHNEGAFRSTAFIGGTALRFLHNLPRFSEDLGFSLSGEMQYNFVDLMGKIKKELKLSGYEVSLSYNDKKPVHYAFVRFENLMYEAGLSPHQEQKFSTKIELDSNPPQGAVVTTSIVNVYFPLSFLSYDLPSLFAGKVHALLNRNYTKGRDFFDLGWYLSRWKDITPNITLLRNALIQTGWKKAMPTEHTWRDFIATVVQKTDWKKVTHDVDNFLERPSDMNIFTKENVLKLLQLPVKS